MSRSENIVADSFSRPSVDANEKSENVSVVYTDVFDLPELANRQTKDFRTKMINEYLNGVHEDAIGNQKFLSGKSVVHRHILPPDCRFHIFSQFHELCHPDWNVTKKMILATFTWPKDGQNNKLWYKDCLQWQQNKISNHIKPKTCQINDGITRFSHMHPDMVGPLGI